MENVHLRKKIFENFITNYWKLSFDTTEMYFVRENLVLKTTAKWKWQCYVHSTGHAITSFFPQMTLHNPNTEFFNITFHGSWIGNFSHDISRLPPVFYICLEDFRPLGIRAYIFGTTYFVLVYAIPGKFS